MDHLNAMEWVYCRQIDVDMEAFGVETGFHGMGLHVLYEGAAFLKIIITI